MKEWFQYLNEYYDNIYVLSVSAAGTRRERFKRKFGGLDYTFFYGADKNNFTIEELVKENIYDEELTKKHHRYSRAMKPGEIACSWSHRMIYEHMIKNNYDRVLIFEDDAVPDWQMVERIPEILSEIPDDCELLMWGWRKNGESGIASNLKKAWYHLQHEAGMLKWSHTMIRNLFARPFSKNLKRAGFHDYTYAYAITRSGAEKLLRLQTPVQYIADNLLAHAMTTTIIRGYIVYPAVMLHDNLPDGTGRDSYIR